MSNAKNIQQLEELLAPHRQEVTILQEVLAEVTAEEAAKRRQAVKELVIQCIELRGQMEAAERKFHAEKNAWDKKLGKLLGRIRQMSGGTAETSEICRCDAGNCGGNPDDQSQEAAENGS